MSPISAANSLGWLAAGLMLAAFSCADLRRLRLLAVAANVAFIAYGLAAHLAPIVALHALLLPVNAYRLVGVLRARPRASLLSRLRQPGKAHS